VGVTVLTMLMAMTVVITLSAVVMRVPVIMGWRRVSLCPAGLLRIDSSRERQPQ